MKDETLLAEALGQEREKRERAESQLEAAHYKMEKLKRSHNFKKIFFATAGAVSGLAVVFFFGFLIYNGLYNYKITDRCYVKGVNTRYVYRKVEWGQDMLIAEEKTHEKALRIMKQYKCKKYRGEPQHLERK